MLQMYHKNLCLKFINIDILKCFFFKLNDNLLSRKIKEKRSIYKKINVKLLHCFMLSDLIPNLSEEYNA